MHGQSPTSIELAGAADNLAKPLSTQAKPTLGMDLAKLPFDFGALVGDADRRLLVGGKDYGACVDCPKPFENPSARQDKRAEALFPSLVEVMSLVGDRAYRTGVGKCLEAVGVSPRNRQPITGNR